MGKIDKPIPNSEFRIQNSEEMTFEAAAARIDEIVQSLEKGSAPLNESLALFEEGAKLIKVAGKMLDDAEQTVVRLQKGLDGEPKESLFDDE